MNSPVLTKSMPAGAAVRGRRFVAIGAADYTVIEAASSAVVILGISEQIDTAIGDQVDVVMLGTTELVLGGTVTRGARLTSDANGAGIVAAPAAGANASIGAISLAAGVAGDIVPVQVNPHIMQG